MCDFSLFLKIVSDYAPSVTNIHSDSLLNGFIVQVQDKHLKRIVLSVDKDEVQENSKAPPLHSNSGLCLLLSV